MINSTPFSGGITGQVNAMRQHENEAVCKSSPIRDVSEIEREAARTNECMHMLVKALEELRDRLRPVLAPEPSEGKHPTTCGETAPGSEVGQLLRTTADHAAVMRRQIDTIICRLAL